MPHPKKRKRKSRSKGSIPTKAKAKEILRHGEIGGKPLTKKQKGYFGARAGGQPVRRKTSRKTSKRKGKRR